MSSEEEHCPERHRQQLHRRKAEEEYLLHHGPSSGLLLLPDSDSGRPRGGGHGFEVIIYTTEMEMLTEGGAHRDEQEIESRASKSPALKSTRLKTLLANQGLVRARSSIRVFLTWLALDSFPLANKVNSLPSSKYQLTIQHLFPFDGQTNPGEMKIFIALGYIPNPF